MWALALAIWGSIAGTGGGVGVRPREISCLGDGSIVGLGEDLRVIRYDGSQWHPLGGADKAIELWRAPDGRVLSWTAGPVVFTVAEGEDKSVRWRLPESISGPRFAFIDGLVAVTSEHLYGLAADGTIKDMGSTPLSLYGKNPSRAPILLSSQAGLVACFGTSAREAESIAGHCIGPAPRRDHYPVDFGDPLAASGDAVRASPPFACGAVVVSNRKGATEVHRLLDGVLVGRKRAFAGHGSGCLPDGRALLIGKREAVLFQLPGLRRLWRYPMKGAIKSAALCGTKIAVLLETSAVPTMIDVPAAPGPIKSHSW